MAGMSDAPDDKVDKWRFEELIRAGFEVGPASLLAADRAVDLNLARRLAESPECGPDLAYQIVA